MQIKRVPPEQKSVLSRLGTKSPATGTRFGESRRGSFLNPSTDLDRRQPPAPGPGERERRAAKEGGTRNPAGRDAGARHRQPEPPLPPRPARATLRLLRGDGGGDGVGAGAAAPPLGCRTLTRFFSRFGKQRAGADRTASPTGHSHLGGCSVGSGSHARGVPDALRGCDPRTGRDARREAGAGVRQPRSERLRRGGGCCCGSPKTRTHKSQPLLCSRVCSIFLQLRRGQGRNTAPYITTCAPKRPLPVPRHLAEPRRLSQPKGRPPAPQPAGRQASQAAGGSAPGTVALPLTITITPVVIILVQSERCLQRQRSPRDSSARSPARGTKCRPAAAAVPTAAPRCLRAAKGGESGPAGRARSPRSAISRR